MLLMAVSNLACASPSRSLLNDVAGVTPEGLRHYCVGRIESARAILAEILAVRGPRTAENTLVPFNRLGTHLDAAASLGSLWGAVHPSTEMQASAMDCEQQAVALITDLSLNRELFEAMRGVPADGLEPDTHRLLAKILDDFRRSGVDKDETTRQRIRALNNELVQAGQQFDKNIADDVRFIELDSAADLEGLPQDYIEGHPAGENGKIRITTQYPDSIPFMMYAKRRDLRERLAFQSKNRAFPQNGPIFLDILRKRRELANLLGYATWAHEAMEDKMIRSPEAAARFIEDITRIATPGAAREYADLLARKRQDQPGAAALADWERGYYEERVKAERFAVDSQVVRQYFTYRNVKEGLLQLTSELFGLRYRRVTDAPVWHPEVESYDVVDAASGRELGRVYLDMHPREAKYSHAAQFTLRSGVRDVQLPEGVLVCNFPDGLMEHGDVVTFFHEFGHLLHHILGGHQRWIRFSGVATEWDFVEAPSQFFEAWAFEYDVLKRFAFKAGTDEVIPADLVARLKEADEFGKGLQARHQMFYASLALQYHLADPATLDLAGTMVDLQGRYSVFPYQEGTHFYANFGHLNGYSSNYYTYMWSEVIARDLLSEFRRQGMMNADLAARYRRSILEAGGVQDAAALVQDFLGRPYSFDAFRQWLERP